jgi:hypothetical protein
MFPQSTQDTEEEITWMGEGLQETLRRRPAGFRKVYLEDGTPVGFTGWSLEQTAAEKGTTNNGEVKGRSRINVKDALTGI